jgi:hypothetical protein
MRFRLVLFASALAATCGFTGVASAAVGNPYFDGKDFAVDSAAPYKFRLDKRKLEPGCYELGRYVSDGLVDVGDENEELQVKVRDIAPFSIDQVLVAGEHSGYAVVDNFTTGHPGADPDIDPNQTATDMQGWEGDDVDEGDTIVCISDHDDSGQNEPYGQGEEFGEVYAKNRPVIQPAVAALGQGAFDGIKTTYKLGLGYSIERWYAPHTIMDVPPFTLALTDPHGFGSDAQGLFTHVKIPPRIEGPVFNASDSGPGVLRVNDIDTFGEEFDNPHYEASDYGQTDVFHANGDPYSFCLGGPCDASLLHLITFGTQGDLPVSWRLKASLAREDLVRSVTFNDAMFREWDSEWQAFYCGEGPRPALPLAPGTNSPTPRDCPVIINLPQTNPPGPAPQQAVPTTNVTNVSNTTVASQCVSNKTVRVTFGKKAKKGRVILNGKTYKAKRSQGRLRAKASLKGLTGAPGSYITVVIREKRATGGWSEKVRMFKLC